MVEDNSKIEEKIPRSPFIQDQRPQLLLPRGKIWKIRRWETGMLMLEVRPLINNGDQIRHYTCPQAIIKSALYHELVATMRKQDDQIIFSYRRYEGGAVKELYFRIIVKHEGTQRDRIIRAVRYAGGTRVTIEMADDCKGLFFVLETLNKDIDKIYSFTV